MIHHSIIIVITMIKVLKVFKLIIITNFYYEL